MIEDINDKEDIRLILDYKRAMAMDKVYGRGAEAFLGEAKTSASLLP